MSLMTDYDLNHSCLMSSYESVRTDEASHVSGTTPDAQPEQHSSSSPPSLSTLDGLSQSHHLIISQGLFSHEPRNLAPITNKIDNPQLVHLIINYWIPIKCLSVSARQFSSPSTNMKRVLRQAYIWFNTVWRRKFPLIIINNDYILEINNCFEIIRK